MRDLDHKIFRYSVIVFNIFWVSIFLIQILNRTYPRIGHDYAYFISHLLDTSLHYQLNGLSIQWYTPSFGGGLPSYANPQQIQFSLAQFLTLFLNPWAAIQSTIIVYTLIGILSFYLFASRLLNFDWKASLLGALFFVVTGFYIGHMISGQLGFITFPLFSSLILVLFWKRYSNLVAGAVIGLLLASLIYQAGFYTLVIFALSLGMTLPALYLYKPDLYSFKSFFFRLVIAGFFFVALSGSKLFAVYTLMRNFPREISYSYTGEYLSSLTLPIISFISQLLGTTGFVVIMPFSKQDLNFLPTFLAYFSGYPAVFSNIWETDNALSPVLIGVFIFALFNYLKQFPSGKKFSVTDLPRTKILALVLTIFTFWFTLEYTLARGGLYEFAHKLPILKSMHINSRFMAAFYFPLALLGAIILNRYFKKTSITKTINIFILLNLLVILSPYSYFLYTQDVHQRTFDTTGLLLAHQQSKQGQTFPIKNIANEKTKDWESLPEGSSTSKPYEPIFGYYLEFFKPKIYPGSVFQVTNGHYNMTNPASLTFPESNGAALFSLFEESDRERLEKFTQRLQPDWKIPLMQVIFNYVSACAFLLVISIILINFLPARKVGQNR